MSWWRAPLSGLWAAAAAVLPFLRPPAQGVPTAGFEPRAGLANEALHSKRRIMPTQSARATIKQTDFVLSLEG